MRKATGIRSARRDLRRGSAYALASVLAVAAVGAVFAASFIAGIVALYVMLVAITLGSGRGLRRQLAINAAQAEQLRSSASEYRLLFEENPQPLIAYDRDTLEIVAVSNATVARYGYSRAEFLAMSITDVHPEDEAPAIRRRLNNRPLRAVSGGGPARLTRARHRYKDGTVIDVEITGDDVRLRGRDCRIVLCQDVTARNRSTAELAVARDQAIEASNTKSAFLANVSHEIRTPMNGVIGMTELLLESGLNSEQRGYAEQVARSGEQMLAIINDILDISKIETGQLELDLADFALRETIEQACAVPAFQAAGKGLAFAIEIAEDVPRYLHGDSGRLRQITLNLAANAVKFTAEGSVTVRVSRTPSEDPASARVHIAITDTGIGVEPAVLGDMFEPFTQADTSTTRHFGGTGLGLAIARELTELMGGVIGAESELGHGSTFWLEVTLPVATGGSTATSTSTGAAIPVAPRPSDGARPELGPDAPLVLVAEDTPVNQIVAVRALQRCGCRSHVVADGHEALQALLAERYDAVLMDCQMPEMDGYQTTGELRRREAGGRRTPVIAMTAHAMKGDLEKCLAAGMDDYISKPLRHQTLAEVLARWIPPTPSAPTAAGEDEAPGLPPRATAAR